MSPDKQAQAFGLPGHFQEIPVQKQLVGNEVVKFGHSELLVLTVPGHSPGSVAFYNKKNGFAIVGDALFAECVFLEIIEFKSLYCNHNGTYTTFLV